jgi:hypothetical protein
VMAIAVPRGNGIRGVRSVSVVTAVVFSFDARVSVKFAFPCQSFLMEFLFVVGCMDGGMGFSPAMVVLVSVLVAFPVLLVVLSAATRGPACVDSEDKSAEDFDLSSFKIC